MSLPNEYNSTSQIWRRNRERIACVVGDTCVERGRIKWVRRRRQRQWVQAIIHDLGAVNATQGRLLDRPRGAAETCQYPKVRRNVLGVLVSACDCDDISTSGR